MRGKHVLLINLAFSLGLVATTATSQTVKTTTLQISARGTTGVQPAAPGLDVGIQSPELSPARSGDTDSGDLRDSGGSGKAVINRSLPGKGV